MEKTEDNAILVLDSFSRDVIRTSVSAIGAKGILFIDGLDEISEKLLEITNNVIILDGFLQRPSCISELKLYQKLWNLNYFFLGSKRFFGLVSKLGSCYECDIAALDYPLIIAALYKDSSKEISDSPDYFSRLEQAKLILDNRDDYPQEVIEVASAYITSDGLYEELEAERTVISQRMESLEAENLKLRHHRKKILSGFREIVDETVQLNKTLTRYSEIFTKDVYDKIHLSEYVSRPAVIYFKEYEDFLNINEFIEAVVSTLKLQERKSVKVVRLFDSSTSRKIITVPDYYEKLSNHYLMGDVLAADFVCKVGEYKKILDKILLNEVGLDVLIIVDSKNYDDLVVTGSFLGMGLCRELEHADLFGLNRNNTIVNEGEPEDELYWGYYDTGKMDNKEKMIYLSSRPVIRTILDMFRYFMQSVR